MNQDINQFELLIEALAKSQSLSILLPPSPRIEDVLSAEALATAILTNSQGKSVSIAASGTIPQSPLITRPISSTLSAGGDNLVISFPYVDGSIDKVDYKIDQGKFNLIVIPRPGFEKVTSDQISFDYGGGVTDCLIVLGCPTLNALGDLFTQNQALLDSVPVIVNIDTHADNQNFGNINIVMSENISLSELVYKTLQNANFVLDPTAATQLYAAISIGTQNLTAPTATPETYEAIAALIRAGAVRPAPPQPQARMSSPAPTRPATRTQNMSQRSATPAQNAPRPTTPVKQQQPAPAPRPATQQNPRPMQSAKPQAAPAAKPANPPRQSTGTSRPESAPREQSPAIHAPKNWLESIPADAPAPVHDAEGTQETTSGIMDGINQANEQNTQTPADWLKPKIMKGGGLV